jgi:ABC-type Fe3+-hydroxamate transport system substrate-binding protein
VAGGSERGGGLLGVAASEPHPASSCNAATRSIDDNQGLEVRMRSKPRRIVKLGASNAEYRSDDAARTAARLDRG